MRTMFKMAITAAIAMVLIGMGFVSRANAQCAGSDSFKVGGIQQQSWEGAPIIRDSLVPASRQSYGRRCRYRWLLEGEVHCLRGMPVFLMAPCSTMHLCSGTAMEPR